ncbi:MAG: CarD family transcriptional regulator [Clostridiaceae bacterium]|nr:CarD family transcriptional regulator [Clostridiaceae bacterium]
MFQINDYIVFGANGVCQITDRRTENFDGTNEREYFVLNPLNARNSTIYAPTDKSKEKMRNLLKRDQVISLIESIPEEHSEWITDNQARRNQYNQILQIADQHELLIMIKALTERQEELAEIGRKLSAQDTDFKKRAEALINDEFALVLKIEPEEVLPFIIEHTSEQKS